MGVKEEAAENYARKSLGMGADEPNEATGVMTRVSFLEAAETFRAGWDAAKADLPSREEVAKAIFGTLEESVAFDWDDVAEEFRESVRVSAAAVLALLQGGE